MNKAAHILKKLASPESVFQPQHVLRRILRLGRSRPETKTVTLPWGVPILVHTNEIIGGSIYNYGIFDKIVPEVIYRLLDRGETALDIGANIGLNTSLMALKTGPDGRVLAFEPHPEIFGELKANIARWSGMPLAEIQAKQVALGSEEREGFLFFGEGFEMNRGTASLVEENKGVYSLPVSVKPLTCFLQETDKIGFCKIDVEGHELGVLQGARQLLSRQAIRDIIFEDYHPQPSEIVRFLRLYGYTIFVLYENWLKPAVVELGEDFSISASQCFNYLATLDPIRVRARFRSSGWRCLLNF